MMCDADVWCMHRHICADIDVIDDDTLNRRPVNGIEAAMVCTIHEYVSGYDIEVVCVMYDAAIADIIFVCL